MNMKVKTTVVIIITLIFGIVFGALLNRTFTHQRIKRAFDAVNPNRFAMILERAIDPTEEQKKKIREILQKHAKNVAELRKNLDKGMASSFTTLQKELDSVLTPEQKERLEKMMKERRPWMRRERPGPPGPFLAQDATSFHSSNDVASLNQFMAFNLFITIRF
jgi:Spy/CpxP family protein refolding chaperone